MNAVLDMRERTFPLRDRVRHVLWLALREVERDEAEHPAEMVESVLAAAAATLVRETEGYLS